MTSPRVDIESTADGLHLHIRDEHAHRSPHHGGYPVHIDLTALDTDSPQGRSLQTPLAKALGLRKGDPDRPRVLDCTGGFGEDAWIMASYGCTVTVCERHPQVAEVLGDALSRAAQRMPEVAARIHVQQADAREQLPALAGEHDVIHIDPMFPTGRKTAERKPMRALRLLVGDDADAADLLRIALEHAQGRVVVKRPAKAKPLIESPQPVHRHRGNAIGYDVYAAQP